MFSKLRCDMMYSTSRKKEVPRMLYTLLSIAVLGGAIYLNNR